MNKKINILQVSRMYYPMLGGIERVVQDIAEGLCSKSSMTILTCQVSGKGISEEIHGVKVMRCGSFGTFCSLPISPSFLYNFRKLSKTMDIIHIHMPFPLADLACILSGYQGKVVLWWHSDVVRQKKMMWLYKPVMARLLDRADMIMLATQGHVEGSSYLGGYREKCRVIPFGVEKEVLKRADCYLQRMETPMEAHVLNFLFIGRLVYYKGCDVMLRALAGVKNGNVTIVGDGPLMESLIKQANDLGISKRVTFLGKVSDEVLNQCLETCDVFVLPSVAKSEAFGIVQMEAMAYGKPVINTNLPSGVPYVSLHHQTGLTVTPGDSAELAEAMNWIADHADERIQYGREAAKRVRKYYNIEHMLKEVWKSYMELMMGDNSENSI